MTTTDLSATDIDNGLWFGATTLWGGSTITYSFPTSGSTYVGGYGAGEPTEPHFGDLTLAQADKYAIVASIWDSYITPTLTRVTEPGTQGDIRVAFTDVTTIQNDPNVYAYAYSPPNGTPDPVNGDVWIDYTHSGVTFDQFSQDFQVLLHETGHALGLKHPFEAPTIPAGYDFTTYTVMSYTAQDNFYTFNFSGNSFTVAIVPTIDFTPMVLDIKAIQDLYTADPTTAAGNSTYAFTDAGLNGRQSIYDAGGTDTIDISALSRASMVDLRPGAYSSLDMYSVAQQVHDLNAAHPGFGSGFQDTFDNGPTPYTWTNNLGIAFSTTIENVIGSAQADTIIGNTVANVITGGGGADTETGDGGADVYKDTAANLNGDTITDFIFANVVYVTDAAAAVVNLSFVGTVLSFALASAPGTTYSVTLNGGTVSGTPQQHADVGGGVDIFFLSGPDITPPDAPTIVTVVDHGNHFDVTGFAEQASTVTVSDTNGAVPAFSTTADSASHFDAASTAALAAGSHALSATATDASANVSGSSLVDHIVVQGNIVFTDTSFTIGEDSALTGIILEGNHQTATANSHGVEIHSIESAASSVNALVGGAGADILVGGIGADQLQGAGGNDIYALYNSGTTIADTGGTDIAYAYGVNYSLAAGDGVESLVMVGTGLTGTGLVGLGTGLYSVESAASDVNTLIGGASSDLLVAGIGADHLQGGIGNDIYALYNSGTQLSDTGGTDIAYAYGVNYSLAASDGVEVLVVVGTGLTGTGHTATPTNLYSLGSAASDVNTLVGGSDADLLVGGIGADHLQGGGGNDIYALYNSGTQISDTGGNDVAYAYGVNYQIAEGSGVETLVMTGSGLTGTGSSGDDILYSVGTGNTLNGGTAGNDSFVFDTTLTNGNTVTGFQPHGSSANGDSIVLSHFPDATFAAAVADGHIAQSGADVVVADATHTIVTLHDTLLTSLHANDFWFA